MTHPVQALIDSVAERLREAIPEHKQRVFKNRTVSLSDEMQELPAFVVTMGSTDPLAGASTMDRLAHVLSITISIIDKDQDEEELVRRLTDLWSQVHRALVPQNSLGLLWAIEVAPQGASAPSTDAAGSFIAKELPTRWQIAFYMNRDDPTI